MPLTYYSRAATQDFWSEHWAGQDVQGLLDIARSSPLTGIIETALPRRGRILEAGCGLGQYVILFRERGRRAVGADWSLAALARCRSAAPGTPLAVMDLGRLAVRSGVFDAYVSLGVVEHDPDGPARIVAEAARVLAPGGRLILSVPYWNGVRKLAAPHLVRQGRKLSASGGEFYQFAYSRREVRAFLEAEGFRVRSFHPYDPARMMRPALRWIGAIGGPDRDSRPRPRRGRRGGARAGGAARARLRPAARGLQRPRAEDVRPHDPRNRREAVSRYTDPL